MQDHTPIRICLLNCRSTYCCSPVYSIFYTLYPMEFRSIFGSRLDWWSAAIYFPTNIDCIHKSPIRLCYCLHSLFQVPLLTSDGESNRISPNDTDCPEWPCNCYSLRIWKFHQRAVSRKEAESLFYFLSLIFWCTSVLWSSLLLSESDLYLYFILPSRVSRGK